MSKYYVTASGDKIYRKDHPPGQRGDYEFGLFKAFWDSVWDTVVNKMMKE